jgi:hypothetical protein
MSRHFLFTLQERDDEIKIIFTPWIYIYIHTFHNSPISNKNSRPHEILFGGGLLAQSL